MGKGRKIHSYKGVASMDNRNSHCVKDKTQNAAALRTQGYVCTRPHLPLTCLYPEDFDTWQPLPAPICVWLTGIRQMHEMCLTLQCHDVHTKHVL